MCKCVGGGAGAGVCRDCERVERVWVDVRGLRAAFFGSPSV